jgi:hypothetical protein
MRGIWEFASVCASCKILRELTSSALRGPALNTEDKGGLKVDMKLVRLVENDISPARGSTPSSFGAPLGGSS